MAIWLEIVRASKKFVVMFDFYNINDTFIYFPTAAANTTCAVTSHHIFGLDL